MISFTSRTPLLRVRAALDRTALRDASAAYLVKRDALAPERDALQEEFTAEYEALSCKLLALFARIKDFQQRAQTALTDPPAGVRGLDDFTAATLRLLEATKLFALETGDPLWPPPTKPFAVLMVESMQFNRDIRYTSEWWRANEVRAAAARLEEEKTAARFARMKAEQEERMNREERERFAAAHGGGIK